MSHITHHQQTSIFRSKSDNFMSESLRIGLLLPHIVQFITLGLLDDPMNQASNVVGSG